ncbi:hypothetical protein [Mesoplasma melaleucae]|uniref:Uncharacterized protein n=1 Tax=Mesoplasma melaleucae TaxID=81459 RepID=A0A2K8NXY4_9MOLU|nr:hypothetical protein [Mesoplasma melaleucae]ATZ17611.1 hypothetical protein EMELA_v1c00190 [Mesoplasma melaleucae]
MKIITKGNFDYSSGYIIEDGSDEVWDLELNDNDGTDSKFIVYSKKVTEENSKIASLWKKFEILKKIMNYKKIYNWYWFIQRWKYIMSI